MVLNSHKSVFGDGDLYFYKSSFVLNKIIVGFEEPFDLGIDDQSIVF